MSNDTIRSGLVDAINEMTQLLSNCDDPNQAFALRIKIRELFHQLDRVIIAILDSSTPEFTSAIDALDDLTRSAAQARGDVEKIAATIDKAASAVNKIEKVVKGVAGVLAIV